MFQTHSIVSRIPFDHSVQMFTLTLEFVLLCIKPELNFPSLSGRIFGIWDSIFGLGASHALVSLFEASQVTKRANQRVNYRASHGRSFVLINHDSTLMNIYHYIQWFQALGGFLVICTISSISQLMFFKYQNLLSPTSFFK